VSGEYRGGCLCGQVRWEAEAAPLFQGYCCCADCRRASGSGFAPFMVFEAARVRFDGEARQFRCASIRGSEAVRNFCGACGGLVFGGAPGVDERHTIYAGSLDDPSLFAPTLAIFTRERPAWVVLPPGLKEWETMPG